MSDKGEDGGAKVEARRFFIDTEFIEAGPYRPITLLSLGIVCEDGRELYLEAEADITHANEWVRLNVFPHLTATKLKLDAIAARIMAFIGSGTKPQFWGYYADYDWVVFCQIFGAMINLPKGWPMYCRDIKQLCADRGNPKLPEQSSTEHHALSDARWNLEAYNFLASCAPAPTPAPSESAKPTGLSQRFNALLKSYGVLFRDDAMRSRLIIDLEQEVALASGSVPPSQKEDECCQAKFGRHCGGECTCAICAPDLHERELMNSESGVPGTPFWHPVAENPKHEGDFVAARFGDKGKELGFFIAAMKHYDPNVGWHDAKGMTHWAELPELDESGVPGTVEEERK